MSANHHNKKNKGKNKNNKLKPSNPVIQDNKETPPQTANECSNERLDAEFTELINICSDINELEFIKTRVVEKKERELSINDLIGFYRITAGTLKAELMKADLQKEQEVDYLKKVQERLMCEKNNLEEKIEVMKDLSASPPPPENTVNMSNEEVEKIYKQYENLQEEFMKYRKRKQQEQKDIIDRANSNLIERLLPLLDNFYYAVSGIKKCSNATVQSVLEGVELIDKQMHQMLEKEGLQVVVSKGCNFDPAMHEVLETLAVDNVEEDIIIEEVRKGYIFKGKLIRPSRVKVACSRLK